MLFDVCVGLVLMVVCLVLQTAPLIWALRYYGRHRSEGELAQLSVILTTLVAVLLILVLGNLAQIGAWALLFLVLGEFTSFAAAYYHSAVNFATLGYGDIVMSEAHRLLGPLESVNGVLMIGVSSATFMAVLQDVMRRRGARVLES
jgi:hypothetical protein